MDLIDVQQLQGRYCFIPGLRWACVRGLILGELRRREPVGGNDVSFLLKLLDPVVDLGFGHVADFESSGALASNRIATTVPATTRSPAVRITAIRRGASILTSIGSVLSDWKAFMVVRGSLNR